MQDRPNAIQMPSHDPAGGHDISFDHVTFSYRPDQPILQVCSSICFLMSLSHPLCCGVLSLLLIHTVLLLAKCCVVIHGQQHDDFILLTVVGLLVVLFLPPTYSCVYLGHWSKGPWPHSGPLSLPQNGSRSFSTAGWHRSQLPLHKDFDISSKLS